MGVTRHHTLVVASTISEDLQAAQAKAAEIFPWVSPVSEEQGNCWSAFFVPPDGGKEGNPHSHDGDARRGDFINWLETAESVAYPGKRMEIDWCEVSFGSDLGWDERLIRSSAADLRDERDARNKPDGDSRDYVRCPVCRHNFVVYTYEAKGEFEGTVIVSGYEPEAGIFCPACAEDDVDTRFELRPGLGWVLEGMPTAPIGKRSRVASFGD